MNIRPRSPAAGSALSTGSGSGGPYGNPRRRMRRSIDARAPPKSFDASRAVGSDKRSDPRRTAVGAAAPRSMIAWGGTLLRAAQANLQVLRRHLESRPAGEEG